LQTGFRGRLPLIEWLRITDPVRRNIAAGQLEGLTAQAPLRENALSLLQLGLTTETEIQRLLGG
jgi:type II secretory ATPase GspE/PulE/Tfp pilus assembly ATPase PilB-like protein